MFLDTPCYKKIECKYPHIAKNIMLLWGSECMNMYFSALLYDKRQGERCGFPDKDMQCVDDLFEIHKKEFPQFLNYK